MNKPPTGKTEAAMVDRDHTLHLLHAMIRIEAGGDFLGETVVSVLPA